MAIVKGRWRGVNGKTVYFQKRSLAFILWLITFLVTAIPKLLFAFISLGAYSPKWVPDYCWFFDDYTDESNEIYKAMNRLNAITDEAEKLIQFIAAEEARIEELKEEIKRSKNATQGYSDLVEVDLSRFKTVSITLSEPEHRWKRMLKTQNKGIKKGKSVTQDTSPGNRTSFIPEGVEPFQRSLSKIAEEKGSTELVVWKSSSDNKSSGGKDNNAAKKFNQPNKLKGETQQSFEARTAMLNRKEEVPADWDIKQT